MAETPVDAGGGVNVTSTTNDERIPAEVRNAIMAVVDDRKLSAAAVMKKIEVLLRSLTTIPAGNMEGYDRSNVGSGIESLREQGGRAGGAKSTTPLAKTSEEFCRVITGSRPRCRA